MGGVFRWIDPLRAGVARGVPGYPGFYRGWKARVAPEAFRPLPRRRALAYAVLSGDAWIDFSPAKN
jgi:hypothetical protein